MPHSARTTRRFSRPERFLFPKRGVFSSLNVTATGGGGGIAFDASPAVATAAATTLIQWNHTCTGAHGALLVALYNSSATSWTVTYNGVAMTQLGTQQRDGASATSVSLFILINPATGLHQISATSSVNNDLYGGSVSFTGVNQTGTVGNSWRTQQQANDGGSGTATISVNVSNAVSGDMVVDFATEFAQTMTVDAAQTQAFYTHNPIGNGLDVGSSYLMVTGATTMRWINSASTFWASIGVALIPG